MAHLPLNRAQSEPLVNLDCIAHLDHSEEVLHHHQVPRVIPGQKLQVNPTNNKLLHLRLVSKVGRSISFYVCLLQYLYALQPSYHNICSAGKYTLCM